MFLNINKAGSFYPNLNFLADFRFIEETKLLN